MAKFCIDKPVAEKLKEAVKNKEIDIAKLYTSTSSERRAVFAKYTSNDLAQHINAAFERAMLSNQKNAIQKWAEAVFKSKENNPIAYEAIQTRIKDLDKIGVLDPVSQDAFLADLVAEKLGITVSLEEAKEIHRRAESLQKAFEKPTDEFGLPDMEYWVERKAMDKYLNSLNPSSVASVFFSIFTRGNMLLSVKSSALNILSNTEQGIMQAFERRLSSNQYTGLNNDLAKGFAKKVVQIYRKSGYDPTRMENLAVGQRRLGEEIIHSEGPGVVRKAGRFYEDLVFKNMMGLPDVVFSAVSFADSVNLASSKIALKEGLTGAQAKARAKEIFQDATSITPKTVEGEIVRSQAIANAQVATWTNESTLSEYGMAIRRALNKATGSIRLGDNLMAFVKTPANLVQFNIEAAGGGFIKIAYKLPEAIRQMGEGNPAPMREVERLAIRGGMGILTALALAFAFKPEDFVGEYDYLNPSEKDLAKLKNATYNAVKINGKWVSLDYLGGLAAPFVGIMYARKYGKNPFDGVYQYTRGVTGQLLKTPGLREIGDLVENVHRNIKRGELTATAKGLGDDTVSFIRARTIPAIVNDIAKGMDDIERSTGGLAIDRLKSGIPGLREKLPALINQITGEAVQSEGFVSTLLFGSRVKTANENKLLTEIDRLFGAGAGPAVTDIERASPRVKELREQIGDQKYAEALALYGHTYGTMASSLIEMPVYQIVPDETKKDFLNKIRDKSIEYTLISFGYKKQTKKKE